jgi:GT2 family glycosyltransferase
MPSVSIIIPVYKKLNEFVQYLQHNIQFFEDCEIIIVNDDPQVHLPKDILTIDFNNPKIIWINHLENQGFGRSVNNGATKATGEYLFLLNTDVKLLDNSWRSVLPEFLNNSNLFAVSLAQKEKDGHIVGRNELYFKDGLFQHRALSLNSALSTQHSALLPTAWAEGGSTIIRKSMWDQLDGFDESYSPFYWEDVDLSYRAKLRGWQVYFAPSVVVEHHHESTIGTEYAKSKITEIAFRNQLYFTDKFAKGLQRIEYYIFKHVLLPLQKMKRG